MTSKMAKYYNKSEEETLKLIIAADLHDIGKLAIPNSILDKPGKLTKEEFDIIKTHSKYTRLCLEPLYGFKDIIEWTSNHHEKLNGTGYPNGIGGEKLDFNSRLLACLDIYQALTEDRPYREALSHEQSMEILCEMANDNLIDSNITKDIDFVFGR
jgi:HD-GYP domain-containing protein (c-di-GMP phosphodiesterase class II)